VACAEWHPHCSIQACRAALRWQSLSPIPSDSTAYADPQIQLRVRLLCDVVHTMLMLGIWLSASSDVNCDWWLAVFGSRYYLFVQPEALCLTLRHHLFTTKKPQCPSDRLSASSLKTTVSKVSPYVDPLLTPVQAPCKGWLGDQCGPRNLSPLKWIMVCRVTGAPDLCFP